MYLVEYIINEYGNLITKSGISFESQFLVVNPTNNKDKEIEVEEDE